MIANKTIIVIGGDLRNAHLSKMLAKENRVFAVGLDSMPLDGVQKIKLEDGTKYANNPDYIILPMPAVEENGNISAPFAPYSISFLDSLLLAGDNSYVLGGKLNEKAKKELDIRKIPYTDYLLREELAVYNAVPTAEGAIQLAMEELVTTLHGMRVLIIGYGRIGKVLASRLASLGAKVTVSARKYSDIAWIEVNSFKSISTSDISFILPKQELIFNTVPATILDEKTLALLNPECLLIDLASKPGGVDFETAKKMRIKTIWALSLPGKVAPITAGEIIFSTVNNIDNERRYSLE